MADLTLPGVSQTTLSPFIKSAQLIQPYLGQIATACRHPTFGNTTNKQLMSRSSHIMRASYTGGMRIVISNWFTYSLAGGAAAGSFQDQAVGTAAAATLTASVEYPAGTIAGVFTFNGAVAGQAQVAMEAITDALNVNIPVGATFWIRIYWSSTAGIVTWNYQNLTAGDLCQYGASGVSDLTQSGASFSNTASGYGFGPVAILGMTTSPSMIMYDDSRGWGYQDTPDLTLDVGQTARSVGASLPYINAGIQGDQVTNFIAAGAAPCRARLSRFVTHVHCNMGINDIYTANVAGHTLRDNVNTLWRMFIGKTMLHSTVLPYTTSTDNWATLANQTLQSAAKDVNRTAFNDYIRYGADGSLAGYYEVADVGETARNSGLWKSNGSAYGYTQDGLHPSPAGYLATKASGALNPALILR